MPPAWPCSVFQLGLPPSSVPQHPAGRSGEHSVVCSRLSGSAEPQMWAEWAAAWRARAGETATRDPALQFGARVVGGAEQQRKAASTHLVTREHHLSAVLHGSLSLQSSLQHPALASALGCVCCSLTRLLPAPSPGTILPRGFCSLCPMGLFFQSCLPPLCLPTHLSGAPGHIIGAQSRRPWWTSFWNLTTIPPAWFL